MTLNTKTPIDRLVRANGWRRQLDYRSALAIYFEIYKQTGEEADLLTMIAQCYFGLARLKDGTDQDSVSSITWIKKAISLRPDDVRLYALLGEYYSLATLDYEQAAQTYRQAIILNPNNVQLLRGAAALYGVPEKVVTLDEAIKWLENATRLDSNDPNYLFRLGEFYLEAGRLADAEEVWRKALMCPVPLDESPAQTVRKMLSLGG